MNRNEIHLLKIFYLLHYRDLQHSLLEIFCIKYSVLGFNKQFQTFFILEKVLMHILHILNFYVHIGAYFSIFLHICYILAPF